MAKPNSVLLDTCAILFFAQARRLTQEIIEAIDVASEQGQLFLSPISAWEIGQLNSSGKLALTQEPLSYFNSFIEQTSALLCDLGPEILVRSHFLPGNFHKDPMDRILIETARSNGLTLVTSDRAILAYGQQGHVKTLAC